MAGPVTVIFAGRPGDEEDLTDQKDTSGSGSGTENRELRVVVIGDRSVFNVLDTGCGNIEARGSWCKGPRKYRCLGVSRSMASCL